MLLDDLPISDVEQVESMQDAVNVCWAYTLNALDFASMPARVILGGDSLSEPVFDKATGEQVGERPVNLDKQVMERIMQITGDNVSIGEWTASNLQAFLPIIQKAVEHIAAETRTPGHYLLTNAEVPATGYEVAEAGLVSKTLERISFMRQPVRELCVMAMMLEDDEESAASSRMQKSCSPHRNTGPRPSWPTRCSNTRSSDTRCSGSPSRWVRVRRTSNASCAWWTTRITIRRWLR